jgi:hypothetical protein
MVRLSLLAASAGCSDAKVTAAIHGSNLLLLFHVLRKLAGDFLMVCIYSRSGSEHKSRRWRYGDALLHSRFCAY